MRNRAIPVLALLVAGTLSACASSGTKYHDRNMDFGALKTVVVMPFSNLSRESTGADRVRDVFANALLSTEAVYVVPAGEMARAVGRVGIPNPSAPSSEEIAKLAQMVKAEAVFTGVLKEYGEIRSGTAAANTISLSLQMHDAATGKVVWAATTTKGGIGFSERLLGGGGAPMNLVTEDAVNDLLDKLFK